MSEEEAIGVVCVCVMVVKENEGGWMEEREASLS
jgi:hypothetical protein